VESAAQVRTRKLRAVWVRYRTLHVALEWGTKAQILWNTRNLLSLVKEYCNDHATKAAGSE